MMVFLLIKVQSLKLSIVGYKRQIITMTKQNEENLLKNSLSIENQEILRLYSRLCGISIEKVDKISELVDGESKFTKLSFKCIHKLSSKGMFLLIIKEIGYVLIVPISTGVFTYIPDITNDTATEGIPEYFGEEIEFTSLELFFMNISQWLLK